MSLACQCRHLAVISQKLRVSKGVPLDRLFVFRLPTGMTFTSSSADLARFYSSERREVGRLIRGVSQDDGFWRSEGHIVEAVSGDLRADSRDSHHAELTHTVPTATDPRVFSSPRPPG